MTVARARGPKRKADELFSKIVRARGHCENCGTTDYPQLQTAHIISRRYSHTRCNELNAFCLCARCHRRFTDWPHEFGEFVRFHRDEIELQALRDAANLTSKVDWQQVADELAETWRALNAINT